MREVRINARVNTAATEEFVQGLVGSIQPGEKVALVIDYYAHGNDEKPDFSDMVVVEVVDGKLQVIEGHDVRDGKVVVSLLEHKPEYFTVDYPDFLSPDQPVEFEHYLNRTVNWTGREGQLVHPEVHRVDFSVCPDAADIDPER